MLKEKEIYQKVQTNNQTLLRIERRKNPYLIIFYLIIMIITNKFKRNLFQMKINKI